MEYQLAFFARSLANDHELIYVLDDPPQLRAAETLATSCLARFGLPFRLLAPAENVGFGPASNIGLRHARGETVCFLNSDVFPKRPDWLERMLETLEGNAHVGMVGALLLYEDDTIQHEGCSFARLAEFGNWMFCLHPNKGRLPGADESLLMAEAVTGACQVMRTDLARALGGFDEGYVIGDFEDADLCRQVQKAGLACVVDRRAQLYHLERQSQGGQQMPWRLNLTLFNAWRFQARWGSAA
jgi:GT2 family glycosyltransferase